MEPNYKELYVKAAGLLQTVLRGYQLRQIKGGTLIISHDPFLMKSVEQHILDTMDWACAKPEPKDDKQGKLKV